MIRFMDKHRNGHGLPVRLGMIALVTMLQSSPLLAVDPENSAKTNAISAGQAGIPWISGGIGDEALAEMHKASVAYNVHLMFTGPNGEYLAGIPFRVTRRNGQAILSGVTEGPLLYLKLAPGAYRVAAEIDGAWRTRPVKASASGRAATLRFVARGE